MEFKTYRDGKKIFGTNCPNEKDKDLPYEIYTEPYGDVWFGYDGGACRFLYQDAIRLWSDGQVDIVSGYYKITIPDYGHERHDICYYCGADCTEIGRTSYDCNYCGGN